MENKEQPKNVLIKEQKVEDKKSDTKQDDSKQKPVMSERVTEFGVTYHRKTIITN
jgi:hypothetical protein